MIVLFVGIVGFRFAVWLLLALVVGGVFGTPVGLLFACSRPVVFLIGLSSLALIGRIFKLEIGLLSFVIAALFVLAVLKQSQ